MRQIKILLRPLLLPALVAIASTLVFPAASAQTKKFVAVTAIVDHPALDSIRESLRAELNANGFTDKNIKWEYQSAQGNTSLAAQIARKYVSNSPDVIVAIGTPSAQAVVSASKTIPIVFAGITDPVAAQLVKSLEPSGTNVTGTTDAFNLTSQMELIKKIVPNAKRIGIVYNPGEVNSAVVVDKLKALLPKLGLTLVEASAPRTIDIPSAARSLVGKVDVFYATTDNNVISAIESFALEANKAKIPLIASDTDSVKRGASAAMGLNYNEIGTKTGKIIVRILNGEKPGNIGTEGSEKLELIVNKKAAAAQGIELSPEILTLAKEVIE